MAFQFYMGNWDIGIYTYIYLYLYLYRPMLFLCLCGPYLVWWKIISLMLMDAIYLDFHEALSKQHGELNEFQILLPNSKKEHFRKAKHTYKDITVPFGAHNFTLLLKRSLLQIMGLLSYMDYVCVSFHLCCFAFRILESNLHGPGLISEAPLKDMGWTCSGVHLTLGH